VELLELFCFRVCLWIRLFSQNSFILSSMSESKSISASISETFISRTTLYLRNFPTFLLFLSAINSCLIKISFFISIDSSHYGFANVGVRTTFSPKTTILTSYLPSSANNTFGHSCKCSCIYSRLFNCVAPHSAGQVPSLNLQLFMCDSHRSYRNFSLHFGQQN